MVNRCLLSGFLEGAVDEGWMRGGCTDEGGWVAFRAIRTIRTIHR